MNHRSQQRGFQACGSVILLSALSSTSGCGGYGDVSTLTYEHAKSLYAITNRQMESKLTAVSQEIESARTAGELPDREAAWLQGIVDDARGGDWQAANQAARRMMEAQVR
ncbi:MAG: hypothetical protein AAF589_09435 [Planctomycetota bacterium]